jgi:hypothetical protein
MKGVLLELIAQSIDWFSISDHRNWSLVSQDFNQYIAKSPHYWYAFLKRYHHKEEDKFCPLVQNPYTKKWVGIDYYKKAKGIYRGMFRKVFQVEMFLPEGVDFKYNTRLYTRDGCNLTSKEFSMFDINREEDGLTLLIHNLDCVYLRGIDEKDQLTYYNRVNDKELNTHEQTFHELYRNNIIYLEHLLRCGKKYKLCIEVIRNVHLFDLTVTCPEFIELEELQYEEGPAIDFDNENTFTWNVFQNDYQDIPCHFIMDGVRINEKDWELIDLKHKFIIPGACIDVEWMIKHMPFKKIKLELREN